MAQYRMPSGALVECSDEVAERLELKPISAPVKRTRRSAKAADADDAQASESE